MNECTCLKQRTLPLCWNVQYVSLHRKIDRLACARCPVPDLNPSVHVPGKWRALFTSYSEDCYLLFWIIYFKLNNCTGSSKLNNCTGSSKLNKCTGSSNFNKCTGSSKLNNCTGSYKLNNCTGSSKLNNCIGTFKLNNCTAYR